jgi:hypothetical protein
VESVAQEQAVIRGAPRLLPRESIQYIHKAVKGASKMHMSGMKIEYFKSVPSNARFKDFFLDRSFAGLLL